MAKIDSDRRGGLSQLDANDVQRKLREASTASIFQHSIEEVGGIQGRVLLIPCMETLSVIELQRYHYIHSTGAHWKIKSWIGDVP